MLRRFRKNRTAYFGWAGTVITVIGLVTLPADISTWRERFGDIGGMVSDNPASGAAVVIGIVLVILASWGRVYQFLVGEKPLPPQPRWLDDSALAEDLYGWLRSQLMQMTDLPAADFAFRFTARDEQGRGVTISKTLADPPVIMISARVTAVREQESIFRAMDVSTMKAMSDDIALEFARIGITGGWDLESFIPPQDASEEERRKYGYFFYNAVPVDPDNLTDWYFIQQVGFVRRAIIIVATLSQRYLRDSGGKQGVTIQPVIAGSDPSIPELPQTEVP